MAGIKMNVEFPTRLCEVNGKLGYFHRWEQWSKVVDPVSIKFCDEENANLCALVKHNEALRKGEVNAES